MRSASFDSDALVNKHVRWLHDQLPGWVTQGVITPTQANAIRRLYPESDGALPWGMLIFSGIGAIVIGLGVVLLLAYNWQVIPKFGKLGLIFGALGLFHGGGLRLFQAADWRRQLGEALGVFGTMLFGAGIWLVAQVYHIDEHYPNGFLLWGLGALAMAWALPSVAQGIIAAVILSIWGGTEAFGFATAVHWAPLLLAVGVGGLAAKERSRLLLAVTLAGFYFLLLTNSAHDRGVLAVPVALNISVLLVGLGVLAEQRGIFPESVAVLRFFGWTGFLVVVYVLSFHSVAGDAVRWPEDLGTRHQALTLAIYGWLPFVLALAAWTWVAVSVRRRPLEGSETLTERWLLPLSALLCQVLAVVLPTTDNDLMDSRKYSVVINFIIL